jgi:class 3 adenylate cyclase/tetratricopeptide (TPR) repeat protein
VLFADLVGFTTLSESRDPEQVKSIVDGCFERLVRDITSFGGRVDKIIGDAIVALFGAPVSHEDDPERAVRAALRMQQTLAEHTSRLSAHVQMRIGVNTGEVLVGPLRSGGDYTALGDAVNIAQRLQVAAPPGGVLVGPATHAATESVIQYESMGGLHARGREELVDAWLAVEPVVPPGMRPRRLRAPLVGRAAERELLLDGLRLAVTHHRAFHAQIEGEGGVGKTRLAEELLAEAKAAFGATVLVSRCLPYGEADVWGPVAKAIRTHAGISPSALPDEVRERTTDAVVAALGVNPEAPEVQRVTEGILQLLGADTPLDGIDPANARSEVVRSVLAFLEGMVRQAPLIITIGDLHWADPLVLDLLDRIVTELGSQPFALITTARPTETERRRTPVAGRQNAVLLRLDPLDQQASADLVRTLLGGDVDADVEEELLDRSGGNPLFLEELASLVQASGEVGGLPDTLRGLVAARLDELSIDERNMLENAAVLGSWGTWQGLVEFGRALNQSTTRDTLASLVSRELLDVDADEWAFRSESVREVAYQTLTKMARAQRHKGVADTLVRFKEGDQVDAIAHHYATSAELTHELGRVPGVGADIDDLAVEWLTRSAERDLDQLVYPGVERRTARGLMLLELAGADADDARRQRLLLVRGHARSDVHDIDAASADAHEVLEVATRTADGSLAGDAHLLLGEIAQQATRYDEAVREYEEAVTLFRSLHDEPRLAEALRSWGMAAILGGDFAEAERLLDEADGLFEAAGDRRGHAWVDQHRAWIAFVQGELELADARLHEAAATFEEMGDSGGLGWTMGLLAWVRYQQGRLDEAEVLAADVARDAGLRGERWAQAMMWVLLAALRLWRGHAESGLALARQARDTFRDLSDRWGELQALVPMSRALAALGKPSEAEQTAEGAMALGMRMNMPALGATVAAGLAAHLGQGQQAVTAGRLAVEELLEDGLEGVGLDAKVGLSLGLLQVGDIDEARAVLESVDDQRAGHGYLASAEALVLAADGRPDDAAAVAAGVGMSPGSSYLDRQTATAALGLAAVQRGDEAEARRILTAGIMGADATDDRVARALARLALAVGLEALGADDAGLARKDADEQLDALGLDGANGWSVAYALAARPQAREPAG